MPTNETIKPRDRDAILQALRAGVVPKIGLRHIQVGRAREVEELIRDVDRIRQGGATIRFVIGEYGAGKTFFLNLVKLVALEKKLVVVTADLAPDRRLHATSGQARSLFAELMRNLSTRMKPEGIALPNIVERFIGDAAKTATDTGRNPEKLIEERLGVLQDLIGGYDFAAVVTRYWRGSINGDEAAKAAALRWLRAEFSTRTEARAALGVRDIISDENFYDHLKLMSRFVRLAGYDGLIVVLDEMVNLYKLTSRQARDSNYEQLLRILNDVLQGSAEHVGFLFGGTPEFLMDTRRGLYSYAALQSRLAENQFARNGFVDLSGPVLRLQNLTPEDLYVLLYNVRNVFAGGDSGKLLVPDEALKAFMDHCSNRIGDAYFRTPRNTITAFVNLLAVLEQNTSASWRSLLGEVDVPPDVPPSILEEEIPSQLASNSRESAETPAVAVKSDDDELTDFRL